MRRDGEMNEQSTDNRDYDALLLDRQLCFPLYACAREVVKRYTPFLEEIGLTYTQYITMLVLWETPSMTSKQIGKRLRLDSGTLTPVLKKLEQRGLILRRRDASDERNLLVELTEEGSALRERAVEIPPRVGACLNLKPEDAMQLYTLLHRMLDGLENS